MEDDELRLCNPSVKKSLKLPFSPLDPSREQYTMFVFGFVPLTNDVKVIAFQLQQNRQIHVAVYTLSEGNWVVRDNNNGFNFDFSCLFRELRGFYNRSNPSYLDGAIHWLGKPPPGNVNISLFRPTHLISLDLETESFSFLELPVLSDEDSQKWRFVFVLRWCLTVFNSSPTTSNIWLLNGDRTWTLWFSGPSSDLACRLFVDLEQRTSVLYFDGDGDGDGDVGSLVYEKSSYSIASGQVRSMGKSMTHFVDFKLYSESLVLAGINDANSPFSWN
ncbi:F-box/kelch-repeat protein At3g06240-like [Silene latifolia]|uniref:F-box/kelch-repeat protein At3g06240-like n=1 Tax=Silene latifolia TaxID=37657 RepID=UPI003D77CFCA